MPLQSAMPSAGAAAAGRVLEISGQGEELLVMLFPHLGGLRVERVEDTGDAVVIRARCREAQARCPACGAVSSRVHGGYAWVAADGAAGGRPVLIALSVRRFRCPDPSCPKATFAEQGGGVSELLRRTHSQRATSCRNALASVLSNQATEALFALRTHRRPQAA